MTTESEPCCGGVIAVSGVDGGGFGGVGVGVTVGPGAGAAPVRLHRGSPADSLPGGRRPPRGELTIGAVVWGRLERRSICRTCHLFSATAAAAAATAAAAVSSGEPQGCRALRGRGEGVGRGVGRRVQHTRRPAAAPAGGHGLRVRSETSLICGLSRTARRVYASTPPTGQRCEFGRPVVSLEAQLQASGCRLCLEAALQLAGAGGEARILWSTVPARVGRAADGRPPPPSACLRRLCMHPSTCMRSAGCGRQRTGCEWGPRRTNELPFSRGMKKAAPAPLGEGAGAGGVWVRL
eukprot:365950-Chlamydomonas_euryale.AAC.4